MRSMLNVDTHIGNPCVASNHIDKIANMNHKLFSTSNLSWTDGGSTIGDVGNPWIIRTLPKADFTAVTSHEYHGTSNHRHVNGLFITLFRLTSKKTLKLCFTGIYLRPVDSTRKEPVMWKKFSCHDIISCYVYVSVSGLFTNQNLLLTQKSHADLWVPQPFGDRGCCRPSGRAVGQSGGPQDRQDPFALSRP